MENLNDVRVIKKSGRIEKYDCEKIKIAVQSADQRLNKKFSDHELDTIINHVEQSIKTQNETLIPIKTIHLYVEQALDTVSPECAAQYRSYRNYKESFSKMMMDVLNTSEQLKYHSDHSNANSDSELVSTKRSLIYKSLSKQLYKKFFLSDEEREANEDGYIYIHDISDRFDTMNCCLFDMGNVLRGGFTMENMTYTEPTTLSAAMNVMGDIMQMCGAQQYGGFTVTEVDTVLEPYAEKSYRKYLKEYNELMTDVGVNPEANKADAYAYGKVKRDLEQGFQALEYNLNTVASSRGDFIFTTFTFGLDDRRFGKLVSEVILEVRSKGQGPDHIPAIFPKLVFLYDKEKHAEGKPLHDIYTDAVVCSSKAQYPDYLCVNGADDNSDGYVAGMYKTWKNGVMRWYLDDDGNVQENKNWHDDVISPMGCRAYLSPYYKKGGFNQADSSDTPVFTGRWNGGAISLNFPMIFEKAKEEHKDFWTVLDYYLQIIRSIHIKTKDYLSKLKASCNPLAFTQGGFYGGNLKPGDSIAPLLDYVTFSFGITALSETQYLYNGKQINEDGDFAYKILCHINDFANKYKPIDHIEYAIYSTPAESLCYTQRDQFVKKFGVVGEVGTHNYFTNSFHVPVWTEISPYDKMACETRFFHKSNGGHICYTRIPSGNNLENINDQIQYAMKHGLYFGVNIAKSYCNDCGEHWDDDKLDSCPYCHSHNITSISRICGYLGFTRTGSTYDKQATRVASGKLAEIKERKCM